MLDTRVVVVDDDDDIRDLVVLKMRRLGCTVISCADGAAALEECRTHRPDIIILDLLMPGLSGLDVCRELRRDEHLARVPVIMLTARALESDIEQGFAAGADDYLVKPFSPRELALLVQAVLERSPDHGVP